MKIKLKKMKKIELLSAWKMQKKGFEQTLETYNDYDISPATEKLTRFFVHFYSPMIDGWWVLADGKRIGALEIARHQNFSRITRFYILQNFRNKGIGQQVLRLSEALYPNVKEWRLDTIFEEKNNVHLYEKLGYTEYGCRKSINEKMTIIYSERK